MDAGNFHLHCENKKSPVVYRGDATRGGPTFGGVSGHGSTVANRQTIDDSWQPMRMQTAIFQHRSLFYICMIKQILYIFFM